MIAAGVLMIFRRTLFPGYGGWNGYGYPPQPGAPQPPAAPVTSTAIVPVDPTQSDSAHHYPGDGQEGR